MFKTSIWLLIVTLLEISNWAFLFAWRLESVILEDEACKGPPLYQIVDPGLAFVPRFYILLLVIKSFTPFNFKRYSNHFLFFYSTLLVSALVRGFDYFVSKNNWSISSSIEKTFACIDLGLCFILWMITITARSELDPRELVDLEDSDDNVLVLQDGSVIRNGRMLSLEATASLISAISFSWMNSLLKSTFNSTITANTLWELPAQQRARENYRLFDEQQQSSGHTVRSWNLVSRLFHANRAIVLYQLMTAIGAVVFHYANPYFLYKLLKYIQIHQNKPQIPEIGYLYCVALFVCGVISTLVASQTLLWGRRWHVNIVHMLNSEIYAHALRLKHPPAQNEQEGEEEEEEENHTDLINQDTERLAELASYLHLLGNSFLAGLVVMVIALPTTHYISQRFLAAQNHLASAKSWRIQLLRELCEGMRTIKILASERRWEEAISNAREDELIKLIKVYTQNTILGLVWYATPVFVTSVSFAYYTLVEKRTLDASLNHIVDFLNTEEKTEDVTLADQDYEDQSRVVLQPSLFEWSEPLYHFRVSFPVQFPVGQLSVISGPTASGKSSLLKALLGDMSLVSGIKPDLPSRFLSIAHGHRSLVCDPGNMSLYLHKVAYVSQTAWIEHGTVRENVLFSEPWDDNRYRTVLHQCDLLRDLSLFENGDLTTVGVKSIGSHIGVNMEGLYQKISLARAVYSRAKTVLIDDIFQPLGKVISTFVYNNCIRGDLMKGRTVIVVVACPDLFWARDASLFVLTSPSNEGGCILKVTENDPEQISTMIQQCKQDSLTRDSQQLEASEDVIDLLFENNNPAIGNFSDDEFFDEASIMPASIRLIEEENHYKRDYAYATYFYACGGWQYWIFAILFTLLTRAANIAESYWLKEGNDSLD
ncbi:hypothetical protein BY458DRAFT_444186 [Sporodiniella umbellata]|nr:hypothetical protein BY458DRAFT_444186 [Sporodiniella umbellata]